MTKSDSSVLWDILSHCDTLRLLNKIYLESESRASDEESRISLREASNLDRENTQERKKRDLDLVLPFGLGTEG